MYKFECIHAYAYMDMYVYMKTYVCMYITSNHRQYSIDTLNTNRYVYMYKFECIHAYAYMDMCV
jgi:hypothetical protein